MYSDKVEVLRFETEPYRKHLEQQNGGPKRNGTVLHYGYQHHHHHLQQQQQHHDNNNSINHHQLKHIVYQNGYHNALIETEKKTSGAAVTATAAAAAAATVGAHHVQPPSDPIVAAVLHSRQNPRPGRLLLENVNNRPQTMDRGTQANTDYASAEQSLPITEAPSTSSDDPMNSELYRNANISVTNQKLMANSGDNSSMDSLNSADSAKRDSEESVIELAEFHQPMIAKDDADGHPNMSNGDGKFPGAGGKPNGNVKEHPVDDDMDRTSCGMECLYFAMQCCECSIM